MTHSTTLISQRDRVTVVHGPKGPGGTMTPDMGQALREAARRRKAEEEIDRTWGTLGGAAGDATGELVACGEGFYRQYANGRIYYRPGHPTCHVYGFIGEKYTQLGGPYSWLGWPTSGEQPFVEGGRVTTFEHGAVYWWPDTGAIDVGRVSVRYSGLYCFGETDGDAMAPHDEPYVVFGVVPVAPVEPSAPRSRIYEEVDGGDSRPDSIELYRGLPYGMAIKAVLFEHDYSDPDKYRQLVEAGVAAGSAAVTAAVALIPVIGPPLAVQVGPLLASVGGDITDAIKDALDTEDDFIGEVSFVMSAKDMVRLARTAPQDFWGIHWHMDSPLISGDGASYKAYFEIVAV